MKKIEEKIPMGEIRQIQLYKDPKSDKKSKAYIFFQNNQEPMVIPYNEGVSVLNMRFMTDLILNINDDATPEEISALMMNTLEDLQEKNILVYPQLKEEAELAVAKEKLRLQRLQEALNTETEKKAKKKGVKGKVAVAAVAAALLIAGGCAIAKMLPKADQQTNSSDLDSIRNINEMRARIQAMLNALPEGPKKTALTNLYNAGDYFNTEAASAIMKEGETKRLAQSWESFVARYLAYNDFTRDELTSIFDTTVLDAEKLYDELIQSNEKEMLFYARATQTSGAENLILSEEGKAFYQKYADAMIKFNLATDKEAKTQAAKDFFTLVRADFPITEKSNEGFVHQMEDQPGYKYSVIPMIATMEASAKNTSYDLSKSERKMIDELGLCNEIHNKFRSQVAELNAGQAIAAAATASNPQGQEKDMVAVMKDGKIELVKTYSYEEIRDQAIDIWEAEGHYDLTPEQNDIGSIEGFWQEAQGTLAPEKKDNPKNNPETKTSSYKKKVTEEDIKKESPAVQESVQKQKDKIQEEIKKENEKEKAEALKKQAEANAKAEEQRKKLEEEVKKDNAWLNPTKPSESTSKPTQPSQNNTGRPNIKDVDDHIKVDDKYVDKDGNLGFDGPIYDKDGNVIDNVSQSTTKAKSEAADSSYTLSKGGVWIPDSVKQQIDQYVNDLANPANSINQSNSNGMSK